MPQIFAEVIRLSENKTWDPETNSLAIVENARLLTTRFADGTVLRASVMMILKCV